MKKTIAISLAMLISFAGCSMLQFPKQESNVKSEVVQPPQEPQPDSESPPPAVPDTPDRAADKLLSNINELDDAQIDQLAQEYFSMQQFPEEYYDLIKPIAKRVTYKIGSAKIDGDKAAVDVSISAIDAQSAFNSVVPGAIAHLAALQITGKDISSPEKILAEYAAKNIKWDELPTIKTDSTLYLVIGADGEWKVDTNNPDNLEFVNAISGGAVNLAQSLTTFAERFK